MKEKPTNTKFEFSNPISCSDITCVQSINVPEFEKYEAHRSMAVTNKVEALENFDKLKEVFYFIT